jgi:hypothetical protein
MIAATRPDRTEAAEYFFTYIGKVPDGDVRRTLEAQAGETRTFLASIPQERAPYRYAPGKWSINQVVSHMNDTERAFVFRALWFARGFDAPLPSFDQDVAITGADADARSLESHRQEFDAVRSATIALFAALPDAAWLRRGTAGGNPFSVRALAYITAGHVAHHVQMLRERYL